MRASSILLRQVSDSGILANATHLRYLLDNTVYRNPQITTNFPDITSITGVELIDSIYASYREVGEENSIVITRSNKRANLFNQGIRNQVLQRESELANTDMVMVIKNNYFLQPGGRHAADGGRIRRIQLMSQDLQDLLRKLMM